MNAQPPTLILDSRCYNLSTRSTSGEILNADPNYKSRIAFDVPDMIVRDESVEYIQFSVPYAVIPVSFFTINETNCNLSIVENSVPLNYIFELGNYNASYFMNNFKILLGVQWGITLDNISSTFTITNSLYEFSFLDTSTIDSIVGFSNTVFSINKIMTMPRVCNFLPLPRITLRCRELSNASMVGSVRTSDIILTIPNNAKPNGQIIYQNQSQSKTLFRGDKMDRFIVSITNDDGDLLNFNGISSFFVFQFDIYRKLSLKPPMFREITNYMSSINMMDLEE